MRILKQSHRKLRRIIEKLYKENAKLGEAASKLRQRLDRYEGPEMAPGQLIQPATIEDMAHVEMNKERGKV